MHALAIGSTLNQMGMCTAIQLSARPASQPLPILLRRPASFHHVFQLPLGANPI